MTLSSPQPFIISEECHKAAWQHGYRLVLNETDGWAAFGSTTAQGTIWLGAADAQGPWYLALDHPGVVAELALPSAAISGPGIARYAFPTLTALYAILSRLYQLATSLPDAPLKSFHQLTAQLPKTTKAERLVIQRIGQDIFRKSLMDYWQGRCPLTGITDPELLRASHIIPWSECTTDAQRLDVHNGLLLSALWDAAFDRCLVTFDNDGKPQFSVALSAPARQALQWHLPISLTYLHHSNLRHHRARFLRCPQVESSNAPTTAATMKYHKTFESTDGRFAIVINTQLALADDEPFSRDLETYLAAFGAPFTSDERARIAAAWALYEYLHDRPGTWNQVPDLGKLPELKEVARLDPVPKGKKLKPGIHLYPLQAEEA